MSGEDTPGIYTSQIRAEETQDHSTRIPIYEKLEAELGAPVVAYYTSFNYPVSVGDIDAQMIEDLLQSMGVDGEFYLMINSPGGSALAAERIINICRAHGTTDSYKTIVPEKSKSAATMVCLGGSEILLSPTSELGPVEPQITNSRGGAIQRFSVARLVRGYEELFDEAVNKTDGNLEPYLQQLENYDEREINEMRSHIRLSEEISIQAVKDSMMPDMDEEEINDRLQIFFQPEETRVHGRPIYPDKMQECGLNIDMRDVDSDLWQLIKELHMRLDNYVSTKVSKAIESSEESFVSTEKVDNN